MKKILLILLISFSLISYGKAINEDLLELNYSDFLYHEVGEEIPYTGEVTFSYENGQIEYKENYIDGLETGEWIFYDKNGEIKYKTNYDIDGGLNIYTRSINKDLLEINSSDFLYHEVGEEIPYTGEVIYYYETGEIEQKRTYINGRQNWEWIQYYKSGKIKGKNFYTDGKLREKYRVRTGEKVRYYETGEIKYRGHYKGKRKNGESVWYYENGQIKSKKNYKKGKLID